MEKQTDKPQKSKNILKWFIGNLIKVIIIGAAIVGLSLISKIPKREQDTTVSEPAPVNVKVLQVTTEPEFSDVFKLPAVVEPNKIVTISTEIDGRIEGIPLEEGCSIKAGDLLIKLNTDLIEPQLEIAQAQLQRDEIQYKRMANLIENDATAQSDFDDAMTRLAISKAQVNEIKTRLERSSIIAPTSGILNKILVEEGEYLQPGMPVAEIVDNETVKVVIDIPERDISFFDTGKQAEVFFDYKGKEKSRTGTISFISELADQLTRATRMEITLSNKEKHLRSGQIVSVALTRQILKDVILIPLASVIPMESGNSVYVVNSTEAKRRNVELGIIKGDNVQIKSGLEPGDNLIISGHRFVMPGQSVNIVTEN